MTRANVATIAALALLAAILLGGCGASSEHSRNSTVTSVAGAIPGLHTVAWGATHDRLSIIVRNEGTRVVRTARAVITARDVHGNAVATTSGPAVAGCCAIVQLAPGASAGLFADLGAAVRRVTAVSVRYTDVALTPSGSRSSVAVSDISLQTGGATTIVAANLTLAASSAQSVSGQAVLTDAHGRVVAVLSQRFACLIPGQARPIRLQLSGHVPAGTMVGSVWTFAVPDRSC